MGILALAVDPGNHAGLAWRNDDGSWDATMIYEQLPETLEYITKSPHPQAVAIEEFKTGGHIASYGLYTVELVGMIKGLCWYLKIPVFQHSPQARYPYLAEADAMLRQRYHTENKLRGRGFTEHELDALSHLLCYETRDAKPTPAPAPSATKSFQEKLRNL